MTPAEKAQAAGDLITVLDGAIQAQGVSHSVALLALLSVVHAIAKAHPCCTQTAAVDCAMVAADLYALSQSNLPPAGAAFH